MVRGRKVGDEPTESPVEYPVNSYVRPIVITRADRAIFGELMSVCGLQLDVRSVRFFVICARGVEVHRVKMETEVVPWHHAE